MHLLPFTTEVAQSGVIAARRRPVRRRRTRRQRLLMRGMPLAAVALIAFIAGVIIATAPGRAERETVTDYVTAWEHRDFAAMYSLLDAISRQRTSESRFAAQLRGAAAIATLIS